MEIKITDAHETVWESFKGVKLEIARSNSTAYIAKLRRVTKQYQRLIDSGELPVEKDIELTCEALAGTVLVGWEPFKVGKTTVEYSPANAANLLFHDPDCRKFVTDIARSSELYEKEADEELQGKS
jgi:hypothetical protein